MTADYITEWANITMDLIPEWFSTLPVQDRNTIITASQGEYESLTAAKNSVYEAYFEDLIAPYAPV